MRCLTNCREIRSKIAERLPAEARSDLWSYEDLAAAFERASDGLTAEEKIDSASCCTGKSGINRYSRDHHEAEVAGALARSRVRAAGAAHPAGSMLRVSRRLEILDRRACAT